MPAGDRTGPSGFGPMTGRGAGYCSGNGAPGYASAYGGSRGRGFGRGNGNGFRGGRGPVTMQNRFSYRDPYFNVNDNVPYGDSNNQREFSPDMEIKMLQGESMHLENDLKAVKDRIAELDRIQKVQD
jgi:hypothetical protein